MIEPRHSTAYLGPETGRWAPGTWTDVVEAAAGGLIDESHWVDLKQELPSGKAKHNTDLAKDLASLAVDGGLLVIGVEDVESHAGTVCGVELAKLADRVDQVAHGKIHPPLGVRSREVPDPSRPGWGCLLVHVPASAEAPHMVDHVYYGRGDRANIRLSDEQVRAILEARARGRRDILAELRRMADEDPIASEDRRLGHLYLLAQPETASDEALVGLLAGSNRVGLIDQAIAAVVKERRAPAFDPDVRKLSFHGLRAEGLAFTSYSPEDGPRSESGMLELVIREDGGLRLICGRGTDEYGRNRILPTDAPQMAVIVVIVLGLAHAVASLAGRLADEHAGYQGQWRLGLRLDRLHGAVPLDLLEGAFGSRIGNPYSRGEYERVTSASTDDLVLKPAAVAERLVAPLLRGLGVARLYLSGPPY